MSSAAELIKDRLNIVDVVGSYIKIEKSGGSYKGRCPFHNEKTPSFFVSPGRASYYCFGCGAKGDIFTFVQEFEKVDFIGALKILADKAGVQLDQFKSEHKDTQDNLRNVLELATEFFERQLKEHKEPLEYLTTRGLTEETIRDWRIGYALPEWRSLHDNLVAKGVKIEDMETVGLVKKSEKGADGKQSIYDRFRSRIIFPLFDSSSRVIAYSGRIFGEEANKKNEDGSVVAAKYLNSPETPLFLKSETLYGYHKAKEGMRQWGYAILVEGQMDLLMCHQNGFNNAVATSGTSLTIQHLDKIKKMSNNLMIVYDADKAGLKATLRAWTAALSLGMDVKIAALPAGEDPASILLSNKEKFKEALKHSKHIIDYYLDILLRENMPERTLWKAVETEVLPYVAALESAIDRSHFITTVSMRTNIPDEALREQVQKQVKELLASSGKNAGQANVQDRFGVSQDRRVLSDSHPEKPGSISDSTNDKVLERLIGFIVLEKNKKVEDARIEELLSRIKTIIGEEAFREVENTIIQAPEHILFEAEMLFSGSNTIKKDIEDLFISLEERVLKQKFAGYMKELQQAERNGDKEKALHILKQCQEVSLQISELNHKRKKLEL